MIFMLLIMDVSVDKSIGVNMLLVYQVLNTGFIPVTTSLAENTNINNLQTVRNPRKYRTVLTVDRMDYSFAFVWLVLGYVTVGYVVGEYMPIVHCFS